MSTADQIEEMVEFEVQKQKEKAATQTMREYFHNLLPEERQRLFRKSVRRAAQVLRR